MKIQLPVRDLICTQPHNSWYVAFMWPSWSPWCKRVLKSSAILILNLSIDQ